MLHELLIDMATDAEVLATPADIAVRLLRCESTLVEGDQRRLRQMLVNLTDNAIKHNASGGFIEFELQALGSMAQIIIRNSGPSIRAEHHDRVFDRFYRGPESGRGQDGSGLGLCIVQWIVHAHKGTITFHSERGITTLKVRLPSTPLITSDVGAA